MNWPFSRAVILLVTAMVLSAAGTTPSAGETRDAPERFTALAVNMGNVGPARPETIEIVVTRWSTGNEREMLVATLFDRGHEALLEELREMPRVGYMRTPDSIGYDLHFAQESPGEDGGRCITLATDRPIGFWEASTQPRSIDYPFTVIELRLTPDGEGEGTMWIAAKITGNRAFNLIELEDYATQPVRLMAVRSSRPPTS